MPPGRGTLKQDLGKAGRPLGEEPPGGTWAGRGSPWRTDPPSERIRAKEGASWGWDPGRDRGGAGRGGAQLGRWGCVRGACAPGEGRSRKLTLAQCQRASVVAAFPGSAGSGTGDMRGGGGKGAALLLLLASVLWVTVQSQQRGEPRGRNTGDPGAGERERAGAAGQSAALRAWGGRTHPGAARTCCGLHGAGTPAEAVPRSPRTVAVPGAFDFGLLWLRERGKQGLGVGVPRFLASAGP